MKADTALVRPNSTIKLNSMANINVHFTIVIYPWYAKGYNAVGLNDSFDDSRSFKLRMLVVNLLY